MYNLKIFALCIYVVLTLQVHNSYSLEIADQAPRLERVSFNPKNVTIITFWATWCSPCKELIPFYNELNLNPNVDIIGVALERGESFDQRSLTLSQFISGETFKGEVPKYRMVLDKFDGGKIENEYLVQSGWFGIPVSFIISPDGRLAEITQLDLKDKSVFVQKIEHILKNTWDYEKAKESYRPEYERGLLQWAVYQNSKLIKDRLVTMTPNLAYDVLMSELRNEPNLSDFLFYEPLVYALRAGNVLALQKHFSEIMDFVKDSERLLEYVLGLLKKESPESIKSEILDLQIEVARRLYFVSKTQNANSRQILNASGVQSVCFDGQCFPVSDPSGNQCLSFLLTESLLK